MTVKHPSGHLYDAWIHVDETDDPEFFIRFLDASRARKLEFARSNPQAAFAHLALEPGLSVLDCGCGTGDMLALIARQVAPGDACGGELSQTMLQEARKRSAESGLSNLHIEPMDVQALPFADETFDRVLATQLLIHVPDPRTALHEMCRVTKRGGRVAVADIDWDSLVIASSDKEMSRRFTRLYSDGIRNGLVVREYVGWLKEEGYSNIQIIPQPMVFDNWPFMREQIIEPSLPHMVAKGAMTEEEASTFIRDLETRNDKGSLFGAMTFYTVVGERA